MHWNLCRLVCAGCVFWMLCLQPFPAYPEEAEPEASEEMLAQPTAEVWFHGRFDTDIDAIIARDGEDINLNQRLELTITPPTKPNLSIHGSFWAHEDVYSGGARDGVLYDIYDTWDSDVQFRAYQMYAQFDEIKENATLRVGRQRIVEGAAYNRIDGVYWAQRNGRWNWYIFGGVRASVYNEFNDDPALGGGVSFRPVSTTRLSLDAYYSEEDRYSNGVIRSLDDTQLTFKLYQQLGQNTTLFGRYDWHENGGDELRLQTTGYVPQWDLIWELSYMHMFDTVEDRVNDLTAFYQILGTYQEYDNFLLAVHKPLSEQVTISLEAEIHRVDDAEDSRSNRDYERYAGVVAVDDFLEGMDAAVALERWQVNQGEGLWALTGEVTKTWESLQLTVGADYSRYEDRLVLYDPYWHFMDMVFIEFIPGYYAGDGDAIVAANELYTLETTENIYSFYGKTRWTVKENQEIRTALTYELDDSPQSPYWRIRMGYSICF